MILHPAVLSLLIGSLIVALMVSVCSILGVTIISQWNLESSAARQLILERRTYLISTIMNYVLGFEVLSGFLFIYTVDDIHTIFIGAMCATGSLNANPVGWYLLYTKIAVFFLAAGWIAVNYIDQQAEDYPLVKFKYKAILVLAPLLLLDAVLTYLYFIQLKPNVITSCCGALFSDASVGVAASLSSLPVLPMMVGFYTVVFLFLAISILWLKFQKAFLSYLLALSSLLLFGFSIASIIAFISLYFYEIPTHHCPFDILQGGYYFIGYPIYISLFGGVFYSLAAGGFELGKKNPTLIKIITNAQKRWIRLSIVLTVVFVSLCSWGIYSSNLMMMD